MSIKNLIALALLFLSQLSFLACPSRAAALETNGLYMKSKGLTPETVGSWLERLDTELDLSDDQRRQLEPIIAAELGGINKLRAKSLSRTEMNTRVRQVKLSALMQMMVILTDEQWDRFTSSEQ